MTKAKRMYPLALIWGVSALLLLVAAIIRFRPQPPLQDVAASAAMDFYSGNASSLVRLVPDYELRQMGISRSQCERFLRNVILPKVSGCHIVRHIAKQTSHVMLGIDVYEIELPDGRRWKWTTGVEISDEGPVYFLQRALQEAWRVEYLKSHPTMSSSGNEAPLWGLLKDRRTFESYGVYRLPGSHEDKPGVPLDDAIRQCELAVARMRPSGDVRYVRTKSGWAQQPAGGN